MLLKVFETHLVDFALNAVYIEVEYLLPVLDNSEDLTKAYQQAAVYHRILQFIHKL